MIRTQVSLSKIEYQLAKEAARRLGISLAAFFRRALAMALPTVQRPDHADKPWMRYAGLVTSGNSRSSREIDDVIYGQKD